MRISLELVRSSVNAVSLFPNESDHNTTTLGRGSIEWLEPDGSVDSLRASPASAHDSPPTNLTAAQPARRRIDAARHRTYVLSPCIFHR